MSYAEMRHRPWTGNWLDVLNDREKKSMGDYAELHRQRAPHTQSSLDDVWNLGDNATSRCNWSEASGRIPTYRLHNQLFWPTAPSRAPGRAKQSGITLDLTCASRVRPRMNTQATKSRVIQRCSALPGLFGIRGDSVIV